jgi:hypothetical protein
MTRKGFTFVEFLAASALAALLIVAVLSVVGALGRDRRAHAALDQDRATQATGDSLARLIEWDLANATRWRYVDDAYLFESHGSLDPQTLAPTDLPVIVRYQLTAPGGKRGWLTRTQSRRDTTGDDARPMPLCGDVSEFAFRPALVAQPPPNSTWQKLPAQVHVTLTWADHDRRRAALDRIFIH